ncbi:hypothetical protein [Amycolatopsis solani]|uniref:hypothetical protein n=1 Tax=Amycolatopsis solani TaxID=3028615 RepID=UPI0025AEF50A|nr:hypothetical protein [Amycolatopsis sp. MEP2-6]
MFIFTITPEDGEPFDVKADSRDVLQWEKRNKGASLKRLLEHLAMEDLYKVAYIACKRLKKFSGDPEEFEASYTLDFEVEDGYDDPSQRGR